MLDAWLDFHRATLLTKCTGLDAAQLTSRAVEPSNLSLLGLVRHMTDVERHWFRRLVGDDKEAPYLYWNDALPDADFEGVSGADPDEAFGLFAAEVAHSRAVARDVSLDDRAGIFSVRWVLVHMIEEYARHNGHADFLRERIDGTRGE